MIVHVTALDRDDGTIWTFAGTDPAGDLVLIAVEHRAGHAIRNALFRDGGPVDVTEEPWQLLTGFAPDDGWPAA